MITVGIGIAQLDALTASGVATTVVAQARVEAGYPVVDAAVETGLAKSKSDARRLIQQGGVYVNNQAVTDVNASLGASHLIDNAAIVLRSGKKNYRLVRVA